MSTTTVKSIGTTGRDYSTTQAWEDASPANLTTSISGGEIWQGQCYNDSEFTAVCLIAGTTCDATGYKHITTGSGQSFLDNANKLTNSPTYNQTNGVGIKTNVYGTSPIENRDSFTIIEKLQLRNIRSDGGFSLYLNNAVNTTQNCIILQDRTNVAVARVRSYGTVINCIFIAEGNNTSGAGIQCDPYGGPGMAFYNCTIVKPSDKGANGTCIFLNSGSTADILVANCAMFGFGTAGTAGTYKSGSDYNATDLSSVPFGGTHNLVSKTYANQFQTVTDAAKDFRVKSGSDIANAGNRDATHTGDLDIVGQSRSTSTPTIGAWEFISSGGANAFPRPPLVKLQSNNRGAL